MKSISDIIEEGVLGVGTGVRINGESWNRCIFSTHLGTYIIGRGEMLERVTTGKVSGWFSSKLLSSDDKFFSDRLEYEGYNKTLDYKGLTVIGNYMPQITVKIIN